ncbi:hypothetical protein [Bordetella hinzii]|uniref:hypothetical protein n=1 Tax=Bordetella hinzii TaxID=103855 RepID=UPI0012D2A5F5|nr:hypothetical protein [Bordetella hinzii]
MDEGDNKKKRNLMITSSAVVAALFLRLKIPSAALGYLSVQAELAVEPWRIWVLILALLAYQIWRFLTDPFAKAAWTGATDFFTSRFSEYAPDSLRAAVSAVIFGGRKVGYSIELMSDLPESTGFDPRGSKVDIRVQDSFGSIFPWTVWTARTGQGKATYVLHELDGSRHWSSALLFNYALPFWQPALWYLRAAHRTIWRSPDCQDLLVPILLAAVAVCGAIARLTQTLTA